MWRRSGGTLVALLLLAARTGSEATAQTDTHRWSAQLSAGLVMPLGKFANTTNLGFGFAGAIGYSLGSHWTMLGVFNAGSLEGDPGPDWNIYSYLFKAAYDTGAESSRWRIQVPLGAGAVTFDPESEAISANTYFAAASGLMFQYDFSARMAATLDALVTLAFTSQNDLGTSYVWLFPVAVGFLIRF